MDNEARGFVSEFWVQWNYLKMYQAWGYEWDENLGNANVYDTSDTK